MTRPILIHLLAAALALTLLNAFKPATMDDPSYLLHARQVAKHPLDPYGAEMFMYQTYGPALRNNAPPVSIYWLAAGVSLLGDHVPALKLWLFPWALLLAFALHALLHRVATGAALPFIWAIMLSPWVLPGFNFMTDVPALAMILAAVALFLHAAERDSVRAAVVAGLLAGLAVQTKYTGAMAPAAILACGFATRRVRLALIACAVAGAIAVSWEVLMYARYGDTQLLHYMGRRERGESGVPRLDLIRPFFRFVGVLGAGLVPLGLAALGVSHRFVLLAMASAAAGFASFALLPDRVAALLDGMTAGRIIDFDNVTLGPAAFVELAVLAIVVWRTGRVRERWDVFLLLWLALEIAGYFLISTGPAARRVIGVLVVSSLLIARVAARRLVRGGEHGGLLPMTAAFAVIFGVAFWAVDLDNARAQRDDVRRVNKTITASNRDDPGRAAQEIWYVGSHFGGFQYYAPRSGMRPAITGRSILHAGDWLVVPLFVGEDDVRMNRSILRREAALSPGLGLPVMTRAAYYFGGRPLRRVKPGGTAATIYRVTGDGVAVLGRADPR